LSEVCTTFVVDSKKGGNVDIKGDGQHATKWTLEKSPPEKVPTVTAAIPSTVPLCAPEIPSNTSIRLPGFFVWCIQGYLKVTNRRVLDNRYQWGVKTHICEVTSDGLTCDEGVTQYEVFHFVHDSTVIRNSPRSTRNLRTVGLATTESDVHVVAPGESIRYHQDGGIERIPL
jgi:hypothetical protein